MTAHEVLGRSVTMPVEVRDASSATAMWEVDAAAVAALLPGGFEVVESSPGRAHFAVVLVDYRDNDLGAYLEVGLIAFARPTGGAGPDGTLILRLPVDQEFTCEAGRRIWGFPKTVEQISFDYADDALTATLRVDGELVLRLTVPRGGDDEMPELPMSSYTLLDGRPHVTRFTQRGTGSSMVLGPEGVVLELGSHPWAKELASLGLPGPALLSTWTERMRATFEDAVPL